MALMKAMRIIHNSQEMQKEARSLRREGKTIGFVPTMGALHEGHLSLIREARRRCDVVVISIFVNPKQFGRGEDYQAYPRDLEADSRLAQKEGVDIIFFPREADMYGPSHSTYVEVEGLSEGLCGASRPGHFRGVTTVVTKLFNIVKPHWAFFGQKDAQQAAIIKRMVEDLNMDIQIEVMPTIREPEGLALSSRNQYLSPGERKEALLIYQALQEAKKAVGKGLLKTEQLKAVMEEKLSQGLNLKIDYISIVDSKNLKEVEEIHEKTLIALAVKIGKTRLIDNMLVKRDPRGTFTFQL